MFIYDISLNSFTVRSVKQKLWRKKKQICSLIFSKHYLVYVITWEKLKMHCCISSATVVTGTCHNVVLYIHCLFCEYIHLHHWGDSTQRSQIVSGMNVHFGKATEAAPKSGPWNGVTVATLVTKRKVVCTYMIILYVK